jgi:hypothetical protein
MMETLPNHKPVILGEHEPCEMAMDRKKLPVILSGAKDPRAKRPAACCRIDTRDQYFALRATASPGGPSRALRMTFIFATCTYAATARVPTR